jgi:peptidoglycan hydrolase-like protein with peptidoglycan-binding domain
MRLAGAPGMTRASQPIPELDQSQAKELQQLLTRRGYFDGEIDGKIGAATRAGVKKAQMQFGLPADSYPTPELLERLRGTR